MIPNYFKYIDSEYLKLLTDNQEVILISFSLLALFISSLLKGNDGE